MDAAKATEHINDPIAGNVRRIHPEKIGIRVLAIAESHRKPEPKSNLAGIVMRKDRVIDGMIFDFATAGGDDATDSIISMCNALERNDINCILLGGLVISMYNIVDGERICRETGIPVIAITFEESKGIESSIKKHYPGRWEAKIEQYLKLGNREKMRLKTGKYLYTRYWGISQRASKSILNAFTLQGAMPEPVRVAKIAAKAMSDSYRK